jgi:Golgi phosphoprotein 3
MRMTIAQEKIGEVFVLQPGDRLDVATGPVLQEVVQKIFDGGGRKLVFDLTSTTYVSSIGLAACLKSAKLAQVEGGHILLAGLTGSVAKVFEVSGLTRLFSVCGSRQDALNVFAAPRSEPQASEAGAALTLPEEILLLALQDEDGHFVDLPPYAMDFALASAVLTDLCMRRCIDSDLERLMVVDTSPVGDDILDPVLAAIARSDQNCSAQHWVNVLVVDAQEIRRRVLDRLVARGILRVENKRLLWVLGKRSYPVIDDKERREVKQRVLGIVTSNEIPSPRDAVIIALADACAIFDAILDRDELVEAQPRIAEVARMDLIAQAMTRALGDRHGWTWVGGPPGQNVYDLPTEGTRPG